MSKVSSFTVHKTRYTSVWAQEYDAWGQRSLQGKHYVYVWADGVHFNIGGFPTEVRKLSQRIWDPPS